MLRHILKVATCSECSFYLAGCSIPDLFDPKKREKKKLKSTVAIFGFCLCPVVRSHLLCRCKHPNNQRFTLLTAMNWYTPGSLGVLSKQALAIAKKYGKTPM